tara:strand:+ start:6471 stop:6935 length:465 start_codon:yes stop_codon:yes gene_type:complete
MSDYKYNTINGIGNEWTLDTEQIFMCRTLNALQDDKYEMKKSLDKFCNVDFIILNKNNLLSVLVEHKRKNINANNFDTFFIGATKVAMINCFYPSPLIFVFECNDNIYWCLNDSEFSKRPTKFMNGGKVIEINKNECGVGFEKLMELIKQNLHI